jgi:hypothetical protein
MAATFRAGATTANDTGVVAKTTTKPTGTLEDDILIFLSHMHDGGATVIEWPAGATELDQVTNGSTTFTGGAAYKVAGDAEPADYTVTNDNGNAGTGHLFGIAAVQGGDTGDPIADSLVQYYGLTEGTPNTAAPSVEGVAGGLLICAWLCQFDSPGDAGSTSGATRTLTKPAEMTLGGTGQNSQSAGGYSIGTWAWEELSADGPTGERTAVLADLTPPLTGDVVHVGISIVIKPAGATLPTADAGPNQTVAQAAQDVQLAGTESGGAGAPYVHTWRIISDTTGGAVLSSTSVEDPTLDMGPAAGVVTLGYKVEDTDEVESAEDTVTITAVGAGAISVPTGDGDVTGWTRVPANGTSIGSALADSSDATYGVYVDPVGVVSGWWPMSEWTRTPGLGGTLQVRPSMIGAEGSLDVELREGSSTVIASWGPLTWTAGTIVQSFPLTISPAEAASIVNPAALRVYIDGEVTEA